MVSAWWLLAAFIVGGYAGILLIALMRFASDEPQGAAPVRADAGPGDWLHREHGHSLP